MNCHIKKILVFGLVLVAVLAEISIARVQGKQQPKLSANGRLDQAVQNAMNEGKSTVQIPWGITSCLNQQPR